MSGCRSVRLIFGLAVAVLLSCSSAPPPTTEADPTTSVSASSSPSTSAAPSSTTSSSTTTTLIPPLVRDGVARAVVTATGVVAPVLESLPEGSVVRTPCRGLAIVAGGDVIDRVHVVLDPGHGGTEPGAVIGGITEASLNLRVAEIAEAQLRRRGVEVILTRYGDHRVPIVSRVEIADRLEAELLVSIHHQGGGELPTGPQPGTEVYYPKDSAPSRRFAGLLWEEAVAGLGRFPIDGWFRGPDAGATYRLDAETGDDFYGMVRRPETPAVLAEMTFMGNPAELELLTTRGFLVAEAEAITDAVVRWFSTTDAGSGFVEPSFALTSSGGGGGLGGCEDPDLGTTTELPGDFDVERVGGAVDSG